MQGYTACRSESHLIWSGTQFPSQLFCWAHGILSAKSLKKWDKTRVQAEPIAQQVVHSLKLKAAEQPKLICVVVIVMHWPHLVNVLRCTIETLVFAIASSCAQILILFRDWRQCHARRLCDHQTHIGVIQKLLDTVLCAAHVVVACIVEVQRRCSWITRPPTQVIGFSISFIFGSQIDICLCDMIITSANS